MIKLRIRNAIESHTGTRPDSFTKHILSGNPDMDAVVDIILNNTLRAMKDDVEMTNVAHSVAIALSALVENFEAIEDNRARTIRNIQIGVSAVGVLQRMGWIQKRMESRGNGQRTTYLELTEPFELNPLLPLLNNFSSTIYKIEDHKPWTVPVDNAGNTIVKKCPSAMLNLYTKDKIPERYHALNALGETPYVIDTRVLQVSLDIESMGKHPMKVQTVSNDKLCKAREELIKGDKSLNWSEQKSIDYLTSRGTSKSFAKKLARVKKKGKRKEEFAAQTSVMEAHGKRMDYERVMELAIKYHEDVIGFKHSMCSRGRAYPITNFLNPQGTDLSKALLLFEVGSDWSTEVVRQLKIHLANCCGQDKGSFDDRVQWVDDNVNNFFDLIDNPLHNEFWNKMVKEDHWQILQASYALHDYYFNYDNTKCRINIGQDASQSGYQILSTLGKDAEIAREVNVLPFGHNGGPPMGDAYLVTAECMLGFISEDITKVRQKIELETDENKLKSLHKKLGKLLEFNEIPVAHYRNVTKRPTMSVAYSAGEDCVIDQVYDDRGDNKKSERLEFMDYDDAFILGKVAFRAINETFKTPTEIMKAFEKAVKGRWDLDNSPIVSWVLPDGFTAFQHYSIKKSEPIKCVFGTQKIGLRIQYDTDRPDKRKHYQGISANVVHSLDACLLLRTTSDLRDEGVTEFGMVHDSFGTSAANVERMREVVKKNFAEILGGDRLKQLLLQLSMGEVDDSMIVYGDFEALNETLGDYVIS